MQNSSNYTSNFTIQNYYPFGMVMPGRSFTSENYRFGYQGSEKDSDVNGTQNTYATHFRMLDTRLGRWMSLDPKVTAFESPYSSMGNNPIMLNDILGDTVKFAGNGEENAYSNYRKEVNSRLNSFQNKLESMENTDSKKYQRTESKVDLYSGINSELNDLEKSTDVFRIRFGISNNSVGGKLAFNSDTKEVDVNVFNQGDLNGVLSHELKHAFQFISGDLGLIGKGSSPIAGYDKTDELEAYKRQRLFTSNTVLRNYSDDEIRVHIDANYAGLTWTKVDITNRYSIHQIQQLDIDFIKNGRYPYFITTGYASRVRLMKNMLDPKGVPSGNTINIE